VVAREQGGQRRSGGAPPRRPGQAKAPRPTVDQDLAEARILLAIQDRTDLDQLNPEREPIAPGGNDERQEATIAVVEAYRQAAGAGAIAALPGGQARPTLPARAIR